MAVLGAPAVRRLGGRTRTIMMAPEKQKRLVIVGATGMVGDRVMVEAAVGTTEHSGAVLENRDIRSMRATQSVMRLLLIGGRYF